MGYSRKTNKQAGGGGGGGQETSRGGWGGGGGGRVEDMKLPGWDIEGKSFQNSCGINVEFPWALAFDIRNSMGCHKSLQNFQGESLFSLKFVRVK